MSEINSKQSIQQLKWIFSHVGVDEIIQKIADFRLIDFKHISYDDLKDAITKVLTVKIKDEPKSMLFHRRGIIEKDTLLFRIRKIDSEDHYFPPKSMTYEKDAWAPPADLIVQRGRINDVGESLLYTSLEFLTAVEEMKVMDDEVVCLIIYRTKKKLNPLIIGYWSYDNDLTKDENIKMRLYQNFLKDEFTRDVGVGTEYLYKISGRIVKDLFTAPRHMQDCWVYPSIGKKESQNVCFRGDDVKEMLELVGVQICKVDKKNSATNVDKVGSGFDEDGRFIYHDLYSEVSLKLFPQIKKTCP
jgi:hypothetical protein